MKKILFGFIGLVLCGGILSAAPRESDLRSKTMVVHSTFTLAVNVTTNVVLVDLSDTVNFPHDETGYINITGIKVQFDKLAASTCSVRLGVVTHVNASTGSVKYFYEMSTLGNVNNTNIYQSAWTDNQFRCLKVIPSTTQDTEGSTPYLTSNSEMRGSTIFQNDVNLPSFYSWPVSNSSPGVGDIIATARNLSASATIVVNIDLLYHSDSR